jgi:hypothetical protein
MHSLRGAERIDVPPTDYLREAQRAALAAAPDPGPGKQWRVACLDDDASLDVDLFDAVEGLVAWIELSSWGWQPVLYSAPGLDTESVELVGVSCDPRVAMQSVLDALKVGAQ